MVGSNVVSDSFYYHIPLAGGQIWLQVEPEAWHFGYPPPPYIAGQPARMMCTATLKDGHNSPINSGDIVFANTFGATFHPNTSPTSPPNNRELTGPQGQINDPNGKATLYMIITEQLAFPDFTAIQNTGQLYCYVNGHPDITSPPKTIIFYH